MKIAILKVKNRNNSVSIGASVIRDELERKGYAVEVCNFTSAFDYTHVLVSMTAVDDIYSIYKGCAKAHWERRTFTAFAGGFGCQNPIALSPYIDWAFYGRIDGIADKWLIEPEAFPEWGFNLSNPHKVSIRQATRLYPYPVKYGANNSTWREDFIGCPMSCKFCHYSHSRKRIGNGAYMNDGISTGSKEVMLWDIRKFTEKVGRVTAGLDGYSERLRKKWGKPITWDMLEDAMDTLASFKGNTYFKIYNICNFPTETEDDEAEFKEFWERYVSETTKADGCVRVDIFNTAFRPSINTPMERCPVMLYPPARRDNPDIVNKNGFDIKYTFLTKGVEAHIKDVISIRYTNAEHIERVAMCNDLSFDWTDYIREYSPDENLKFKWII